MKVIPYEKMQRTISQDVSDLFRDMIAGVPELQLAIDSHMKNIELMKYVIKHSEDLSAVDRAKETVKNLRKQLRKLMAESKKKTVIID